MTTSAVRERAESLRSRRVPFVHARVVLAEKPTSAKPGDEALVLADGTLEGFVGGQCAEETIRAQGLMLLQSGDSMLLRIVPNPESDQSGKTVVHNPCLSGGTLEIFLEPVLPPPLVCVVGESPIARALGDVAASLGYEAKAFEPADLAAAEAVVVASHGKDEEATLTDAVRAGVPYVGLIASRIRGKAVLDSLDLTDEEKAGIHTPAGLDIGARTAAEIALSVLAEVIAERSLAPHRVRGATASEVAVPQIAIDPVCGMSVVASDDALVADVEGERVYFCSTGCRQRYLDDPSAFPRS